MYFHACWYAPGMRQREKRMSNRKQRITQETKQEEIKKRNMCFVGMRRVCADERNECRRGKERKKEEKEREREREQNK